MLSKKLFLSSAAFFVLVSLPLIGSVGASSEMWSRTYGGAGQEVAYAVVETSDGGYAIAGYTNSSGAGYDDFWLVKTDSYGNLEWNRTYGGAGFDGASSLVVTSNGGFAIAGGVNGSICHSKGDFWLIKTDAYGNVEWNKTYSSTTWLDYAQSVVETSDGGYTLAGNNRLIKTDAYWNMEWSRTYGETGWDTAHSLVVTSDGGYAIAGETSSFGAGDSDFWLVKTDEYGIIPEFPSWIIIPLFLTATLAAIFYSKRVRARLRHF